jgi:superfamily II DNA/RNA helicase
LITDIEDVKFVINFDYPSSSEDYIHRIGRTGRSHQMGTAYAFFTPHNMKHANDLISVLLEANQVVNPKLSEMAEMAKCGGSGGRGGKCLCKSRYMF